MKHYSASEKLKMARVTPESVELIEQSSSCNQIAGFRKSLSGSAPRDKEPNKRPTR